LLKKQARKLHYSRIADPSTIAASELEYESEANDYDMEPAANSLLLNLDGIPTPEFDDNPHIDLYDYQAHSPMDVDAPNGAAASLSDLEEDFKPHVSRLDLEEIPDADEWKSFDEEQDHDTPISHEEMRKELDEMMDADQQSSLWDSHT
jgi:hypothetical protein